MANEELMERLSNQIRQRLGFSQMSAEQGLELFDAARELGEPLLAPVHFDTAALRARAQSGALAPIMRGLIRVPARREAQRGSLGALLATMPAAEHQAHVLDLVRSHTAAVLGHASAADVEPARAFQEMGLDSLGAVELRNRLSGATRPRDRRHRRLRLPQRRAPSPSTCWPRRPRAEQPSGLPSGPRPARSRSRSSAWPAATRAGSPPRQTSGISSPPAATASPSSPPTAAGTWSASMTQTQTTTAPAMPARAASSPKPAPSTPTSSRSAPVRRWAWTPRSASCSNPAGRPWRTRASTPPRCASPRPGSSPGSAFRDYGPVPGMTSSVISGRVSYTLGLEGPAMTIDTACSSSLVAMHLAAGALRQGECTLALAGGVTVLSTPAAFISFSAQRGLAPDGRSKSFAEAADGVAWSEGVGVLVLERLSDARRNGHPILALLKGAAVNQDGASNGLTAPNGPSQERVIRQALANARLEAKDVDVVEGHGTGTTLGDPIEAGALLATYGQERERAAAPRLDQVQHRPRPGGSRSRRGDQDGNGDARGRHAEDPARRCSLLQSRLGGG